MEEQTISYDLKITCGVPLKIYTLKFSGKMVLLPGITALCLHMKSSFYVCENDMAYVISTVWNITAMLDGVSFIIIVLSTYEK